MRVSLRVLLADDAVVVRRQVKALLEAEGHRVVGEAGDGDSAVQLARVLDPDIAVLDLTMPRCDGIAAAQAIQRSCPRVRLIVLTVHRDDYQVARAFRAGAQAYVCKTSIPEDLLEAIRVVANGGTYLSPSLEPREPGN